jgi:hypothetical protein
MLNSLSPPCCWTNFAPRTGAILQVFEQRGRARSSPNKAANPADARIQAIRDRGRNDPRHRTGGENQETTIQPQITNRKSNHRSGNVGRGLGGLKPGKSFARQKHTLNKLCTRTQSACRGHQLTWTYFKAPDAAKKLRKRPILKSKLPHPK